MHVPNLAAWLLERGADDAPAIVGSAGTVTYARLRRRVREVCGAVLAATAGVERAIVPLLGGSSAELVAAHLGVLCAGAVSAPLPPLGDQALREVLRQTRAPLVLTEAAGVERLRTLTGAPVIALDAPLAASNQEPRAIAPHALAVLLYTSGSTSAPKGVMLSAANVGANTTALVELLELQAEDRALSFMPLHYSFGLSVLHTHLRAGGSLALSSAVYPGEMLAALQTSGATGLPGVPTLFATLLQRTALATTPLPRLRQVMISGGRLDTAAIQRLRQALPGVRVYLRYGVTEATAGASVLPPERADKIPSVGRGLPGAPLLVLRPDGTPVAPGQGEAGEIVIKSESVALGYLGEDAPHEFRDGAFYTGDVATVDDEGYVFVVGRERDFVKTAGYRVSPAEIEEVITALPFVEEAAVCGVPHPILGESLVCFVKLREGSAGTVAELRERCAQELPTYKVPSRFELVPELPKTSNGKLDRRRLTHERGAGQGENAPRLKAEIA